MVYALGHSTGLPMDIMEYTRRIMQDPKIIDVRRCDEGQLFLNENVRFRAPKCRWPAGQVNRETDHVYGRKMEKKTHLSGDVGGGKGHHHTRLDDTGFHTAWKVVAWGKRGVGKGQGGEEKEEDRKKTRGRRVKCKQKPREGKVRKPGKKARRGKERQGRKETGKEVKTTIMNEPVSPTWNSCSNRQPWNVGEPRG